MVGQNSKSLVINPNKQKIKYLEKKIENIEKILRLFAKELHYVNATNNILNDTYTR